MAAPVTWLIVFYSRPCQLLLTEGSLRKSNQDVKPVVLAESVFPSPRLSCLDSFPVKWNDGLALLSRRQGSNELTHAETNVERKISSQLMLAGGIPLR